MDTELLRRGRRLEWATLLWNVVGVGVLTVAATQARSVALVGFGLDSLIEIGASSVVLWELAGTGEARRARALRLIGGAFAVLSVYVAAQSIVALTVQHHPHHSGLGVAWTATTVVVMLGLAAGKTSTGRALHNPVLETEGRVTYVDALLAAAVLAGLALNATLGAWWADPVAGLVIVAYGTREAAHVLRSSTTTS